MGAYISKSKRCYNAEPSAYYFYVKTKIWLHFHICISVPIKLSNIELAKNFIVSETESVPVDQTLAKRFLLILNSNENEFLSKLSISSTDF